MKRKQCWLPSVIQIRSIMGLVTRDGGTRETMRGWFNKVHNISGYWGGEGLVLYGYTMYLVTGEGSGWFYMGTQHIWLLGRGEAGFTRVHNISGYWGGERLVLYGYTTYLVIGEGRGWFYKGTQHIWLLGRGGAGFIKAHKMSSYWVGNEWLAL